MPIRPCFAHPPESSRRWWASVAVSALLCAGSGAACAADPGFASSFERGDPAPASAKQSDKSALQVTIGNGPEKPYAAKAGMGYTGLHALHYRATAAGRAQLFAVDLPVEPDTVLSWMVLPEIVGGDTVASTGVVVDLLFDDGRRLSELGVEDQPKRALSFSHDHEEARPHLYRVDFDNGAPSGGGLTLDASTSLISVEQAQRNLQDAGFELVQSRAQDAWDAVLGRVQVQGASHDQRVTVYSNLYRLFLYPNIAHENVGDAAHPDWRHADQNSWSKDNTGGDAERTAAPILPKVYVNNGFWDTFRTSGVCAVRAGKPGFLAAAKGCRGRWKALCRWRRRWRSRNRSHSRHSVTARKPSTSGRVPPIMCICSTRPRVSSVGVRRLTSGVRLRRRRPPPARRGRPGRVAGRRGRHGGAAGRTLRHAGDRGQAFCRQLPRRHAFRSATARHPLHADPGDTRHRSALSAGIAIALLASAASTTAFAQQADGTPTPTGQAEVTATDLDAVTGYAIEKSLEQKRNANAVVDVTPPRTWASSPTRTWPMRCSACPAWSSPATAAKAQRARPVVQDAGSAHRRRRHRRHRDPADAAPAGFVSAEGVWSDSSKKTDGQFSGSYSWHDQDNRFGVFVGYTQQKRTARTLDATTENWQWYGRDEGGRAFDVNGKPSDFNAIWGGAPGFWDQNGRYYTDFMMPTAVALEAKREDRERSSPVPADAEPARRHPAGRPGLDRLVLDPQHQPAAVRADRYHLAHGRRLLRLAAVRPQAPGRRYPPQHRQQLLGVPGHRPERLQQPLLERALQRAGHAVLAGPAVPAGQPGRRGEVQRVPGDQLPRLHLLNQRMQTRSEDNFVYNVDEKIYSTYLQLNFHTERLRGNVGVRVARTGHHRRAAQPWRGGGIARPIQRSTC
ncbi:glycoside hydrolase family 92 protein [Pantoea ananatis]|nr:glycoside hydrolase family 92 protein [Pantoea ananatis]